MQHHERGCPILAFFARVGHDAAQGGRRVEQAFQACVQSHTRLVPSGRTGLQGAKRRLHTQGLGGWPIHAAPRERVPHPRVLCEGGTRCRLRREEGGAGLPVLRTTPPWACAFRANWPARSEATQPASSWASGRGAREPWAQEGAKRRLHPQRRRRQHLPCTATSQGSKTNRAARRQPDVFSAEAQSPIAEARPSLPPPARPLPASERWQHYRSPCPARPAE
jgi:hypothetical protein